jgi:uncharacterized membrane protein
MSTQPKAHAGAPRRYTSAVLTGGVAAAAILFGVAVLAEVAGADPGAGEMTDLGAVVDGLFALTPWAWAAAGAYAVLATPVLGLVVTAWEYWSVGDRRVVALALAVMGVLGVSAAAAILRSL